MDLSDKKIINVCAWAESLWHFRVPLLKKQSSMFKSMVIYCPDSQYCADNNTVNSKTNHVQKLKDEGFNVKIGPISKTIEIKIISQIWSLYRFLRKERFDILIAHQPMGGVVGITAGFLAGVPLRIYSTGGMKQSSDRKDIINKIFEYLELVLIRLCDSVFMVNREDEDFLNSIPSARGKAFHVGPRGGSGIDTNKFSRQKRLSMRPDARRDTGVDDDTVVIGFVGRCTWKKGFRDLVDAVEALTLSGAGKNILCSIIGEGTDRSEIQKYIASKSLSGRFKFLGYKYNSDYYMSAWDIFVLPSYREGLPVALLESMSMGIPSIATDIRGCRELISSNHNGLLISPRNTEELSNAIRTLLEDPEKAALFGKRAEIFIHENFEENSLLEKTMEKIDQLMRQKEGKRGQG